MNKFYIIILFLLFTTLNLSCESKSKHKQRSKSGAYIAGTNDYLPVTKIVDGDTFWADNGTSKGVKVRLIGVDAPESRNVFKKVVGYYGKEAKAYLSKMISGKNVKLIRDVDSLDQYGRTLAYVYLEDGTFINADIVKNGYAMVMTIPPNVKHADEFVKFQQEARENSKGLWGIKEK